MQSPANVRPANRIHVIGGPGSKKTTLAKRLAADIPAQLYELDYLGYENGAEVKRPVNDKLDDVSRIAESESWITEGIFLWWTEALLEQADVIVWLDTSWATARWRIIIRHFRADLKRTNQHSGLARLRFFLFRARDYYRKKPAPPLSLDDDAAVTRSATALALEAYVEKVVHCHTNADVDKVILGLGCGGLQNGPRDQVKLE